MTYQTLRNEIAELQKRLDAIAELCRPINHSGVNPETHRIAHAILKIIDAKEDQK